MLASTWPFAMSDRCTGVEPTSSHSSELRDLVLVSLQCAWLCAVVPLVSHKQRRQDRVVRLCQLQESQSTGLMVNAVVKAPLQKLLQVGVPLCGRLMLWVLGAGVAFATARGFLGNDYFNDQAEYFALLQCLFRALLCRTLMLFLKWIP